MSGKVLVIGKGQAKNQLLPSVISDIINFNNCKKREVKRFYG